MTDPHKIWIEQCKATENIEAEFGTQHALDYLVGENFLNFLEAAETDDKYRDDIPAFVLEIKKLFEAEQLAQYLATAKKTEPWNPKLLEDIGKTDPEETEVVPTDSKPSKTTSPDHKRALRKAHEALEGPVADRTARLSQTKEQLRHEIKKRQDTEKLLLKEQRHLRYLMELQDRDQRMVAYEIHDGLAQQLAAAIMQFEMFSRVTGHQATGVWKTFETGRAMLSESMREACRLINCLRSPILDELGVVAAIEDLISQNGNQEKPEIYFVHQFDRERLTPSLGNVIFRIVQESLTNARRYSQSDRLLVRLTQRDDYIRIEVQDWGIGFNPKTVGDGHFGLEGIQERARLFGGSATIKSAVGKGTRIVVHLPLMGDVDTVTACNTLPSSSTSGGQMRQSSFRHSEHFHSNGSESMRQSKVAYEDDLNSALVIEVARKSLQKSPYTAIRNVSCDYDRGVPFLRGRLASYHQKQVAQEAVSGLEGVVHVVNQIEVAPP